MWKLIVLCSVIATLALGATVPQDDEPTMGYIVGGKPANITDLPYIVSMQKRGRHLCGGTIVAPNYIVTAAHCCYKQDVNLIGFRAGSTSSRANGTVIKAKKIYIHPRYKELKYDSDVAVVELQEPLKFSNSIKAIPLATCEPATDSSVQVSGWGHLQENGNVSENLQTVFVPTVDRKVCASAIEFFVNLTDRMFCAGIAGKDSCQGDSGGPLVENGHLAGIVSFGVGCGRDKYPGVYTNVANPSISNFIKIFF